MDLRFLREVGSRISIELPSFSLINLLTLVLAVVLLVKIQALYSTIDVLPGNIDEDCWIHGAYFYHLLFLERDFSNEDWYNLISYDQPPVSKYILGFALHVSNSRVVDTSGDLMKWQMYITEEFFIKPLSELVDEYGLADDWRLLDYSYSLLEQTEPTVITTLNPEDYVVGRRTVFLFAVLATALLVAIGFHTLKSPFIGVVAGLIFLCNNVTIPVFQLILPDSICCFFVLSTLLILFQLFRELSRKGSLNKKVILLSILEGLFLSLALGTKLITTYMAVTVVLIFTTSILLEVIKSMKTRNAFLMRRLVLQVSILILILVSTFSFFVLLNPFLYPNPISNTLKMVNHRLTYMEMQSRIQVPAIKSFSERIEIIYKMGVLLGYEFHNISEKILYISALILGVGVLIKKSLNELPVDFLGSHTIILLWVTTTFVVNGLMVNMQWERYYIPFVMCTALMLALGVETIIKIIRGGFNKVYLLCHLLCRRVYRLLSQHITRN